MTRIAAGRFKDQCLKILDTVAQTRTTIIVTKRGRPVAAVVPYSNPKASSPSLAGSILRESGPLFRTGEEWDADAS